MSQAQPRMGFYQMLVFLVIIAVIVGGLVVGGSAGGAAANAPQALATKEVSVEATVQVTAPAAAATDTVEPRVYFISPVDGATVPTTFTVQMNADGLIVEPLGVARPGAGHFHILVDTSFIDAGTVIPSDAQHIHFGKGQTETELTLEAGDHTLRLQFADGLHRALEGDEYRDEITVKVEAGG